MKRDESTGERIAELRRIEGLTQKSLIARLRDEKGITIGTSFLSQIKSGVKKPSIELAKALADVLGASLDYILMRTDDPSPQPDYLSIVVDTASPDEMRILRIIINEVQAIAPDDQETVADVVRLFGCTIAKRKREAQQQ